MITARDLNHGKKVRGMSSKQGLIPGYRIERAILFIRDHKVMLDAD